MNILGIKVKVHWTWWIYFILTIYSNVFKMNYPGIYHDLVTIVILFFSVLGHEFSHALMARYLGYKTESITMHILGGLAKIDMANIPSVEELLISIAGPAFNMAMTFISVCLIMIYAYISVTYNGGSYDWFWSFLIYFCIINLVLGLFNLIPAYPMDGGRILRSSLSLIDSKMAMNVSRVFSLVIGIAFVFSGLYLGAVGLAIIGLVLLLIRYAEGKVNQP